MHYTTNYITNVRRGPFNEAVFLTQRVDAKFVPKRNVTCEELWKLRKNLHGMKEWILQNISKFWTLKLTQNVFVNVL